MTFFSPIDIKGTSQNRKILNNSCSFVFIYSNLKKQSFGKILFEVTFVSYLLRKNEENLYHVVVNNCHNKHER